MIEATSCGEVVIFRGKILILYKNYHQHYDGWVLPKGTVEEGELFDETAIREVKEETDANAAIVKYIGSSSYSFTVPEGLVEKTVHWYLMSGFSYHSRPLHKEYFEDSGYYKYHEAYHLLKFSNEKIVLKQAYREYVNMRRHGIWTQRNVSKNDRKRT
ncbi:MAG: NUDIX domain-containing protein [Lachnospiraceae bacterium]|nr:NUDIX domain-containing protein [Lachnospiraceae bacterium]